MFTPDPVRRPREQVEKQLRDAIVTGVFKRGDRLPSEATLAQEFQVARSTVREALQSLAADGLVTKTPGVGGGSFVQNIDHESLRNVITGSLETILKIGALTIDEVTAVRRTLEIPAARLAAENRTDEQAAEMRALITRQNELVDDPERGDGDPELFDIGPSIYNLIGEATGNRLLGSFVSAVSRVAIGVYLQELRAGEAEKARALTSVLVEAIAAGDADAAEATMTSLLTIDETTSAPTS
ncbi:FadR/GntR family transcriptional regulator [Salinibacterium sp. GXW1014]|uniref:FadR/GntR family transcriptional regulator n=1 Tax=Salinibacterium sp. GXW1014 TaxID=3377838 RepID=UPI00383A273A